MTSPRLVVSNIKITIATTIPFHSCNQQIEIDNKIYAVKIYSTSPWFINVTGLRSFADISSIRSFLTAHVLSPSNIKRVHVDSIFASRRLSSPVLYDMERIAQFCRDHCKRDYFVSYNPEITTSKCLLLPRRKTEKRNKTSSKIRLKQVNLRHVKPPQISLFYTGSVTVMGLRSVSQIREVDNLIEQIYQDGFKRPVSVANNTKSKDFFKSEYR